MIFKFSKVFNFYLFYSKTSCQSLIEILALSILRIHPLQFLERPIASFWFESTAVFGTSDHVLIALGAHSILKRFPACMCTETKFSVVFINFHIFCLTFETKGLFWIRSEF